MFTIKRFKVKKSERIMQQINAGGKPYSPTHIITRDDANNKYILYGVADENGTLKKLESRQTPVFQSLKEKPN